MMHVIKNEITGNADAAQHLREIADMVESGAVRDIVVVYDNRLDKHFARWGTWDDKWRILGALEYAKATVVDD